MFYSCEDWVGVFYFILFFSGGAGGMVCVLTKSLEELDGHRSFESVEVLYY